MTAPEDLTVENFGPLLSMVGTWEGHKGMDFSYHNEEQETGQTSYFERVTFSTFGPRQWKPTSIRARLPNGSMAI